VPASVVNAPCFAYRPTDSAACWDPKDSTMTEATWMNASGLYPPLFYATLGVFVGDDISTSVIVMRVFNSALVVGLLAGVFFALPRRIRPVLVISALAAAVPLGMFVIASTNPSSWAFASAATVWVCLYGATQTRGRRQIVLAGLAVIGATIGAGARADASLYSVFAVMLAAILGARRRRSMIVPAVAAVLVLVISAAFYLSAGQSGVLTSGLPNDNPPLTRAQHVANLVGVPQLWWGAFGGWGLGWLDTLTPAAVAVLGFGVFASAVFIGIHRLTLRRSIAVGLAFAALWLVPFILLARTNAVVGSEVQPRYILPLIVILLGVASLTPRVIGEWQGPRSLVAGLALSVAMSLALHDNIRRYTVGSEGNAIDPGAGAEWWWTAAPAPIAVWLIGSASFPAAVVLLWLVNRP
jgi:hypothetical protein